VSSRLQKDWKMFKATYILAHPFYFHSQSYRQAMTISSVPPSPLPGVSPP